MLKLGEHGGNREQGGTGEREGDKRKQHLGVEIRGTEGEQRNRGTPGGRRWGEQGNWAGTEGNTGTGNSLRLLHTRETYTHRHAVIST